MALTSLLFIIPTSYGLFAVLCYIVVAVIILKNWKMFRGSFFTLYLASTIINIWTFFNQFVTIRFPQSTCKDCALSFIFDKQYILGLEFFYFMQLQFAYIQFMMITITSLNRCSMIYYPYNYENMWRRLTIPLVLFVCFIPTSVNYPILTDGVYYKYLNITDRYITIANARSYLQPIIVPFMIIVTLINVMLNTAAMTKLVMHRTAGTKKSETNLLIMSLLNFIIQALAAFITVANFSITSTDVDTYWYAKLASYLLPYISDLLTLISPFLLFSCSSNLRYCLFGNRKMFRVSPNSLTRTSQMV